LCREKLQLDPPAVSAMLAEKWQFPPLLSRPIALQHQRGETDPAIRPLVEVVSTGVLLADVFVAGEAGAAITAARGELAVRFGLPPADIEALLEEIGKSAREAAALLDVQIGKQRSYPEILEEAQEAIMSLSLQSQHQVQTITRQVQSLQRRAATDPLTGLANRARFDEFFEEHFRRAYTHERPLALLFLDVDHFKKVNDTYGHQAGDEVLRRVSRVLRGSIRSIDLAARYGGEEFAVVLTETDTAAAAARADLIRKAITMEPISVDGRDVRVTISIGVAGTDRTRIFTTRDQLTNAADRAVYAAKAGGRNAVRVFKPQVKAGAGKAAVAAK
jgi:diguanylate cyclase (GGDEF)-like protein